MRLSDCIDRKSRHLLASTLTCFLVACGGSGGQDPILGTPSIATSPRVILTTPAKLFPIVTAVARNTALTAKFSRDMSAASLNASSFTVACPAGQPITGTVTYDPINRLAILQHAADFAPDTTCTATITTQAKDTAGIGLAKAYVWSFTTGSTTDTTQPTITANSPADGATAVCLSKSVNVTFSEAIDPTTLNATTFKVIDPSSVDVPGAITYDTLSNTATFSVTNPPGFTAGTVYTSLVTTSVKDLAGNALTSSAANTTSFTTGTQTCEPTAAVNLGTISTYGAFGSGAGATNSGVNTIVNGDLGTTGVCTSFTGFHDANDTYRETTVDIGEVTGDIYCAPPTPGTLQKLAIATQAATDARIAYDALAAKAVTGDLLLTAGELGLKTVTPGVYKPSLTSAAITAGDLTLDAQGDANAVWIFQITSSLTVGNSVRMVLKNGAQAKNVYWQVGSAATLNYGSSMAGTIIAYSAITFSTAGQLNQTTLIGRAIALNESVTMVNTTILAP